MILICLDILLGVDCVTFACDFLIFLLENSNKHVLRSVWINMSSWVSNDWNLCARIPDSIGKDIEKACQGVYPLHDVYVRKVKVLKKPKFDGTCSLCAHWGHSGCNMLPSCCSFLTPVIFGTAVCDSVQLRDCSCMEGVAYILFNGWGFSSSC